MDIHEDRWPRHLHLVHLVLPTVHLLCRSRSQHRAGAPAPIAAPRWQGGLRSAYQPRLARRKLLSSARVTSPDVLRALLRAHRLLAAEIFRVRSGSGALQPTFRPRELKERRARPRRAAVMYAMAGGAGRSCRSRVAALVESGEVSRNEGEIQTRSRAPPHAHGVTHTDSRQTAHLRALS